jgi:hypothetical protein
MTKVVKLISAWLVEKEISADPMAQVCPPIISDMVGPRPRPRMR